jgi:CubicO group peptidase (beta-lactamase class C family)
MPLAHHPGTAWEYSMAVDVTGRLIEVVSGMPLDRFVAAHVTGPLKMADTGYYVPEQHWRRIAQPMVDSTTGADLSGSAAIAGFCPHRTHRAALPQWALQEGPEAD